MIKKIKMILNSDYNVRLLLCSAVFLLLGIIGFWTSSSLSIPWLKNVLSNISAVLIVSGLYNVTYEYLLKVKFIEMFLEKIQLKESISHLGLIDVKMDIGKVAYDNFIETAREIDIVHAYGETWTKNYFDKFEKALTNRDIHIRVCLLSPDSIFCTAIDHHYGRPDGNMRSNIIKMQGYWENLKGKIANKSSISVTYFDGNPVHSFYRFDNTIICVSNKIGNTLSRNLPCFICRNNPDENALYTAYQEEINSVMQPLTAEEGS